MSKMHAGRERKMVLEGPSFYHPAFEEAFRYIIDTYDVPPRDTCIFLPCSMKKPYSRSRSHAAFDTVIFRECSPKEVHLVVFGTCGVVPRELERMYPFAHYRYMLGRCTDPSVRQDFHRIERFRLSRYLEKTKGSYGRRVAFCLGGFRRAMTGAAADTGIDVRILPSDDLIAAQARPELRFPEGSLLYDAYLEELAGVLRDR